MRPSICLAACLVILASCDRPSPDRSEAPDATAFSYTATVDLSGYYLPVSDLRPGVWSLSHVFIGQPAEFSAWPSGQRDATFAPVMLQFDDATSPMVQTELGEAHSIVERVLPTSYSVSDGRIRFDGESAKLGTVRFDGRLDPGALATARRNLGDDGTVLTGQLTIGDLPPRTVSLRWWMGD